MPPPSLLLRHTHGQTAPPGPSQWANEKPMSGPFPRHIQQHKGCVENKERHSEDSYAHSWHSLAIYLPDQCQNRLGQAGSGRRQISLMCPFISSDWQVYKGRVSKSPFWAMKANRS
ncbi:hypothetical protein DdX_13621 [Ditylenchus destructor]|uniref:Uncharacterized protein n=1 Tax=Ditylenchus destructor TaxID=166010 RepID=A0AAD4MTP7_9BILA|nr:hypothetical protein DdX_13621 [Ditylenchus destructor]